MAEPSRLFGLHGPFFGCFCLFGNDGNGCRNKLKDGQICKIHLLILHWFVGWLGECIRILDFISSLLLDPLHTQIVMLWQLFTHIFSKLRGSTSSWGTGPWFSSHPCDKKIWNLSTRLEIIKTIFSLSNQGEKTTWATRRSGRSARGSLYGSWSPPFHKDLTSPSKPLGQSRPPGGKA